MNSPHSPGRARILSDTVRQIRQTPRRGPVAVHLSMLSEWPCRSPLAWSGGQTEDRSAGGPVCRSQSYYPGSGRNARTLRRRRVQRNFMRGHRPRNPGHWLADLPSKPVFAIRRLPPSMTCRRGLATNYDNGSVSRRPFALPCLAALKTTRSSKRRHGDVCEVAQAHRAAAWQRRGGRHPTVLPCRHEVELVLDSVTMDPRRQVLSNESTFFLLPRIPSRRASYGKSAGRRWMMCPHD